MHKQFHLKILTPKDAYPLQEEAYGGWGEGSRQQGKHYPSRTTEFLAKLTALSIKKVNEYHPRQCPK